MAMESGPKIFAYCERGLDPSFWAEPFNAITNLGFILGACYAAWDLSRRPKDEAKLFRYALILNVVLIGIGSFLFHTYATPRASAADVVPIGVFMLAFLGYALHAFAGVPLLLTLPAIGALPLSSTRPCKCSATRSNLLGRCWSKRTALTAASAIFRRWSPCS